MARKPNVILTTFVLFVTWIAHAGAETGSRLDRALQERSGQAGYSRVIIQTRSGGPADAIVRSVLGAPGRRLDVIGGQVAQVANQDLANLANHPDVLLVHEDRRIFPLLARTSAIVGADLVWHDPGLDGRGVGIAVIDSGVTSWHDDLSWSGAAASGARGSTPAQRVVHFVDYVDFRPFPHDDFGHGTHVAGIIAGNGSASGGARSGVAPAATIVALKVLDAAGTGFISDVISAIDYAIARRHDFNIRVINLSIGAAVTESSVLDPLAQATKRAVEAGMVVVAAAGNLGRGPSGGPQYGGITAPGNAPWVLTVGAASHGGTIGRTDDTVAEFSSRGPTFIDWAAKPDLVAPGVGIESLSDPDSTFYREHPEFLLPGTAPGAYLPYLSLSGTSMSAPVVSGTVALMLQANPGLTPNAVKAILQYTSEVHPGYDHLTQGAGFLNARGAVRLAQYFATPQTTLDSLADDIAGGGAEWSRHIIWGNYRLDGGLIMPGATAWETDVMWGAAFTLSGDNVVWGISCDPCEDVVWAGLGPGAPAASMAPASASGHAVQATRGRFDNIVWGTRGFGNIVWGTRTGFGNIVWGTGGGFGNIVWGTGGGFGNIVWGTGGGFGNIVWGTRFDNIVWGTDCGGADCENIIWGSYFDNIVWGTWGGFGNIVWGTGSGFGNIVWGTATFGNIVWGVTWHDNVIWNTSVLSTGTVPPGTGG